jgi:hypothetical protein
LAVLAVILVAVLPIWHGVGLSCVTVPGRAPACSTDEYVGGLGLEPVLLVAAVGALVLAIATRLRSSHIRLARALALVGSVSLLAATVLALSTVDLFLLPASLASLFAVRHAW